MNFINNGKYLSLELMEIASINMLLAICGTLEFDFEFDYVH